MAAGGAAWTPEQAQGLVEAARRHGCAVHLDGARLFNAAVALDRTVGELGAFADSVTVCLSKGLSAPAGSVLAGSDAFVAEARRNRKRLGGAMRQVGILAAAGRWALDNMVERLGDDHERARELAELVAERWPDALDLASVVTNVVTFTHRDPELLLGHLRGQGILATTIAPGVVRWVTHRHITAAHTEAVAWALAGAPD